MTALGTAYRDPVLDSLPSAGWVGLFTSAPGPSGGGTEVSGGAYARQALTLGAASGGQRVSTSTIEFPQATADWGLITHFAVFDAASGGAVILYGALAAQKPVSTGDVFRINAGNLSSTVS
ncbi:MAG: hypothetical protein K2Q10_03745 [Rhodospirillales bacterium]|nr:hypothetical protein [Rhodospirillales bacterium]